MKKIFRVSNKWAVEFDGSTQRDGEGLLDVYEALDQEPWQPCESNLLDFLKEFRPGTGFSLCEDFGLKTVSFRSPRGRFQAHTWRGIFDGIVDRHDEAEVSFCEQNGIILR